jgi:hypothetical protein
VLVVPSPKFHCQAVGVPIDASVNCTDWPGVGEEGEYLKDAARAAATVTFLVVLVEPELFVMVRATVLDPAVV